MCNIHVHVHGIMNIKFKLSGIEIGFKLVIMGKYCLASFAFCVVCSGYRQTRPY